MPFSGNGSAGSPTRSPWMTGMFPARNRRHATWRFGRGLGAKLPDRYRFAGHKPATYRRSRHGLRPLQPGRSTLLRATLDATPARAAGPRARETRAISKPTARRAADPSRLALRPRLENWGQITLIQFSSGNGPEDIHIANACHSAFGPRRIALRRLRHPARRLASPPQTPAPGVAISAPSIAPRFFPCATGTGVRTTRWR